MKHVIQTGTDAATVCCFDAAALPESFSEQFEADQIALFERLEQEGRFWWASTESDGGFLFHIYVDEAPPEQVMKCVIDPRPVDKFMVPSGVLWACGVEYAAKDPATECPGALAKYPHMGGKCEIPAGEYKLSAWRTEWLEDEIQEAIRYRVGEAAYKRKKLLSTAFGACIVLSLFGWLVPSLGLGSREVWFGIIGTSWLAMLALGRYLMKLEKSAEWREPERDFPGVILHLERLGATS